RRAPWGWARRPGPRAADARKPRRTARPGSTGTRAWDLFNNIAEGCRCPDPPPEGPARRGPRQARAARRCATRCGLRRWGRSTGSRRRSPGRRRRAPMKQMEVGLAAVLIDATVIRGVLLPSVMALLGERNWYLPKWLHRLPDLTHGEAPEAVARPVVHSAEDKRVGV